MADPGDDKPIDRDAGQDTAFDIAALEFALSEVERSEERLRARNADLVQAEVEAGRGSEKYEDLFAVSPYGNLLLSPVGIIRQAGNKASQMLNVRPDCLAGKPLAVYLEKKTMGRFLLYLTHAKRTMEPISMTATLRPMNGGSLEVEMLLTPVADPGGEILDILVVLRDLTEQTASESTIRAVNDELERYASILSHDLEGPISAVLKGLEMLKETAGRIDDEAARSEVMNITTSIEANAKRAYELVDDLLDLTGDGDRPTDVVDVDVASVVRGVLTERVLDAKRRDARVIVDEDLGHITANRKQVRQAFANLIDNSLRHGPESGISVELSYLGTSSNGGHRYRLTDNGPGLPDEVIAQLGSQENAWGSGALGVGLSIVKKTIELYGGSVEASNMDGAVIEFCMFDAEAGGAEPAADECPGEPLRVLVVEDEEGTAGLIARLLEKRLQAHVDIADGAERAKELLSVLPYDVVTLDYRLTDGSGLEVMREIAQRPQRVPVIAVTGHGDEKTAARFFELGASGYVVKDQTMADELMLAIGRALSGPRLVDAR
jgi:signal transduction histidine kinase/CheY-like chemotaxis protein